LIFETNEKVDFPQGEMPFESFKQYILEECASDLTALQLSKQQDTFILQIYLLTASIVDDYLHHNPPKNDL